MKGWYISNLTSKNYRYFEMARHAAELSDYRRTQMGAVAVYKGKVLSVGWNSTKTSPLQQKYNQYRYFEGQSYVAAALHAETACLSPIRELEIDWNKVELYIYRICKSREHGLAKPCSGCRRLILDLGIKHIFYTGDNSFICESIA